MKGEKRVASRLTPDASPIHTWFVYILRCADDTFYTGIARDLARRIDEHNSSNRLGASYTRGRRPVTLVYREETSSRSLALRREHEIKTMKRHEKAALLESRPVARARKS